MDSAPEEQPEVPQGDMSEHELTSLFEVLEEKRAELDEHVPGVHGEYQVGLLWGHTVGADEGQSL